MSDALRAVPVWLRLWRIYARLSSPIVFITRRFIGRVMHFNTAGEKLGGLCIDVGAGTGPYKNDIERYFRPDMYVAFEFSPNESTTVAGNAMSMPFRNDCANVITGFELIQHISDSYVALAEMSRVLAPGGILLLTFPFNYCECDVQDFRRWTVSGMRHDLELHGLTVLAIEQRGGRFFAAACGLNWIMQHLVPGQRKSWRATRTPSSVARSILLVLLTLPTTVLQWIMYGVDCLWPNHGCYMGGIAVAMKRSDR